MFHLFLHLDHSRSRSGSLKNAKREVEVPRARDTMMPMMEVRMMVVEVMEVIKVMVVVEVIEVIKVMVVVEMRDLWKVEGVVAMIKVMVVLMVKMKEMMMMGR